MSLSHGHDHVPAAGGDVRRLVAAAVLLAVFTVAEVTVAVLASSLALLADAGHLLTDVLALSMAAAAARLARRAPGGRWTFGLARTEILSAAVNGVTLVVAAALVLVEAVRRLVTPTHVDGPALVYVAAAGLAVNLVATTILTRADRRSLNITAAIAHVATDAAAFAATIVAGIVIWTTGAQRADPVASLVVVALMVVAAVPLVRESVAVLLEATPAQVDLDELRTHLLETEHVIAVHDLHVWTSGARLPTLSAHVVVEGERFHDGALPRILDALQACLAGHFDVEHSTFQLEPAGHVAHESELH